MTPSLFDTITKANKVNSDDYLLRLTVGIHYTKPANNEVFISDGQLYPKKKFLSYKDDDGISVYSSQKILHRGKLNSLIYEATSDALLYVTATWNSAEMIAMTGNKVRAKYDPIPDIKHPVKGKVHSLVITGVLPPDKEWEYLRKDFYEAIHLVQDERYFRTLKYLLNCEKNSLSSKK